MIRGMTIRRRARDAKQGGELPTAACVLLLLAGWLALSSSVPARAAERVTLRTGSNLICDHVANLHGQVRLYMTPSEDSYLDVAAGEIVRTESVREPVPVAASDSAQTAAVKTPGAQPIDLPRLLDEAGAAHHLDPDLLASVVHAESDGRPGAVSRAGARGLMQLMPATAADLGVRNSFAAEQNVAGGTAYLDALLMYYHEDIALALAAYNAGPAAVDRYHGIPPYAETRRYVERVIHDFNQRKLREARQRTGAAGGWSSLAAITAAPR